MTKWYEQAFGRFYPVVYRHRDTDEAQRMVASFADVLREPILDLACGAGRYMSSLSRRGIDAFGVDLSEFLLERAAGDDARRGRLALGDMRAIPYREDAFNTVINMFTSFGYFESDDDNRVVIAEVARVLRAGGVFVLDFINRDPVLNDRLEPTSREQAGFVIEERRRIEDGGRYVVKRVTARNPEDGAEIDYEERLRLFTSGELDDMLRAAGFEVEAHYGDYRRTAFDAASSARNIVLSRLREKAGN